MDATGKVGVDADVGTNLIRLTFVGVLTRTEMEGILPRLASALREQKPGFSLLTDFTDLDSMAVDSTPIIDQTMELVKAAGVGLVVRIIPDRSKDIGMSIMSLFHYPRQLKIVTTESRAEAAAILRQTK